VKACAPHYPYLSFVNFLPPHSFASYCCNPRPPYKCFTLWIAVCSVCDYCVFHFTFLITGDHFYVPPDATTPYYFHTSSEISSLPTNCLTNSYFLSASCTFCQAMSSAGLDFGVFRYAKGGSVSTQSSGSSSVQ
jgi:hypothetical protein